MPAYETVFISSLPDEALDSVISKAKGIIEAGQGKVISIENMGVRPLEYNIKKEEKGAYVCVRYSGDRSMTTEMEKYLRLTEGILRCMTVRMEEKIVTAGSKEIIEKGGREEAHE